VPCSRKGDRAGYSQLRVAAPEIKATIFGHQEFTAFNTSATKLFAKWKKANAPQLNGFAKDGHPKQLIDALAEDLLATFEKAPLLDPYDIYQHLMDYWAETMRLAERYAMPLPALNDEVATLAARVDVHLRKMGFAV